MPLDATAKDFEQDRRISLLEARAAAQNKSMEDAVNRIRAIERKPDPAPQREVTLGYLIKKALGFR